METASESMADQKSDGDELDTLRRQKKPDSGRPIFAAFGEAPKRNRRQTIRDLFQVWICAQPVGPRCLSLRTQRSVTTQRANDLRRICRLDSIQQRNLRSLVPASLSIGLVCRSQWKRARGFHRKVRTVRRRLGVRCAKAWCKQRATA